MSASRIAKAAIKIPLRIERGPTDILKALASTVRYLPDQPGPFLQDDPYLLPIRPIEKRVFENSKLSGVKTAQYIFRKYPELFYRDDSEPKVEAFTAPEQFEETMKFDVSDLKWCIDNDDVINGIIAYKALVEANIKIDDETLLNFLELLSFSNEEKLPDFVDIARSRIVSSSESDLVDMSWKKNGLASQLFNKIKDDIDPPRAYSIMIAALSKFNEHATAIQVFEDYKVNHPDKALYNDAYDALIGSSTRINSSKETLELAMTQVVDHMSQKLVKPDVRIFNSILRCYIYQIPSDEICQKSFQLLNDMQKLGVEFSLTTISYVIGIICKYRNGRVYGDLIPDLLNYAKSDKLIYNIADRRDLTFLRQTMRDISHRLHNLKFAHQLHQIYMKNPNLAMNELDRRSYLDEYFKLIITMDNLDNIMNFYRVHRAIDYEPSPDIFEALGEALDMYQAPEETIKEIYDDIVMFMLSDKINHHVFKKFSDKKKMDKLPNLEE